MAAIGPAGVLPSRGVLPACQVTAPCGAEPAAAEGAVGEGNRVDGRRNRSRPAVGGRAFSCPWPVRASEDPWVYGRMTDGSIPL
jgi:hypothetical protein